MALTLDHLVILVPDLRMATLDYEDLGFVVTPGGTHADGLTHNALVVFADGTYFELIAFVDLTDKRDNVWGWRQFVASGGLIDYCCATNDLAATVADLKARGWMIKGPTDGGRKRPDGVELRWRSARFEQLGRTLPFLIEDVTPRELRVPGGAAAQHPNGATGIRALSIATRDLDTTLPRFTALFQTAPQPTFMCGTQAVAWQNGAQRIALYQLLEPEPNSPIERTDGPASVELAPAAARLLDRRLTNGVNIYLS